MRFKYYGLLTILMVQVYYGVMAESTDELQSTVVALADEGGNELLISSPIYISDSRYSALVVANSEKTPMELLGKIKKIEKKLEHAKIYILFYGGEMVDEKELTIPYKNLLVNISFLRALEELNPDIVINGKKLSSFIGRLNKLGKTAERIDAELTLPLGIL